MASKKLIQVEEYIARLNEFGEEILDPTPMAVPVHMRHQRVQNLTDDIRRVIESMRADEAGFETFEEADDFDVGDDYEPRSRYELDEEQENYEFVSTSGDDSRSEGGEGETDAGSGGGKKESSAGGKESESGGSRPDKGEGSDDPDNGTSGGSGGGNSKKRAKS